MDGCQNLTMIISIVHSTLQSDIYCLRLQSPLIILDCSVIELVNRTIK